MKSKSLLIFLLGCSKMLVGQDSHTFETVQDSAFVTPQYSSVYDDVFMNKKETKWLFKVDWMGITTSPQVLSFEHKLTDNISMNYSLGSVSSSPNQIYGISDRKWVLGVQPRWYFKNKTSNSVSNLNGNYVGLNALYSLDNASQSRINWGLIANYGIQRRVFNLWYIDWQFGLGMDKFQFLDFDINGRSSINDDTHYWLHNKFTLGLAFGGGKKSATNKCDLFSCFEEEKSLWKLDIRDVYQSFSRGGFSINFNPEYERKIGKSSFSINTGLGVGYSHSYFTNGYVVNSTIEPRYYYNMKKRVVSGKSANNLSGNYFSINVKGSYARANYTGVNFDSIVSEKAEFDGSTFVIEPRWGIQRRLFKNGFLDFSLAPFHFQKSFQTFTEKKNDGTVVKTQSITPFQEGFQYFKITDSNIPFPKVYFKIGFAF
jgi:hypothetical protein